MIAFALGLILSAVAALPAYLLIVGGERRDFKDLLKRWAVGMLIRFSIIGGGLLLLFTQSGIDRVPAVIGVGVAYLASFILEARVLLHSK